MNTERINVLIEKMNSLRARISKESPDVIDLDLMMDYTRVLYADLIELRKNVVLETRPAKSELNKEMSSGYESLVLETKQAIVIEKPAVAEVEQSKDRGGHTDLSQEHSNKGSGELNIDKPIQGIEKVKGSESPAKKSQDIRHFITINDRFLFMSELFKNNKFDYESALDIINNLNDFSSAEKWLKDNYFDTEIWQPDHQTVTAFVSALQSRFKQQVN